jgi:hypothetical protein
MVRPLLDPLPDYHTRYGYPLGVAIVAEFWWRVEHLGVYRGGDGGLFGAIQRFGYRQRKAWERRGCER